MGALKRSATEKRQGTKSRWGMCGGAASTMGIWSRRLDQWVWIEVVAAMVLRVSTAIGGLPVRCAATFAVWGRTRLPVWRAGGRWRSSACEGGWWWSQSWGNG